MNLRSLILSLNYRVRSVRSGVSARGALVLLLFAAAGLSSGCDRLKAAVGMGGGAGTYTGDPAWQADSMLLANSPAVLYRVVDHKRGRAVVPFATLGNGLRRLTMTERGWRAFDLSFLQDGRSFDAIRDGRISGTVRATRGFWTVDGQLDTLAFADCKVPAGLAEVPADVKLMVSGFRPKPIPAIALSEAEIASALSKIPTLVAPSLGVPRLMMGRYRRDVYVMNTGVTERPSIMVVYNDPEVVPDSVPLTGERPRQLIVILDKSVYGYKPSYNFTTVGSLYSRMTFLDYLDVDNDGKAEIFFGIGLKQANGETFDATVVLRAEGDGWRRFMGGVVRCEFSI